MSRDRRSADDVVALITDIFDRHGADSYLGERVTMAEHMRQAAALAEAVGADDEVIAAALLHDIGHYTNDLPASMALERDNRHEEAGAQALAPFFPPIVVECVRHHVDAKRYLCATDPAYRRALSPASVQTLELQGGPMDEAEAERFARTPHLEAILAVRRFDDAGKDPTRPTPPLEHWLPLVRRLIERHRGAG
jgi:phosphonate degradation associated HDIG domain protein